jgi:hypothetical protein
MLLDQWERPLGELHRCGVLIDGTPFRDRHMIVALGINVDGVKRCWACAKGYRECHGGQ